MFTNEEVDFINRGNAHLVLPLLNLMQKEFIDADELIFYMINNYDPSTDTKNVSEDLRKALFNEKCRNFPRVSLSMLKKILIDRKYWYSGPFMIGEIANVEKESIYIASNASRYRITISPLLNHYIPKYEECISQIKTKVYELQRTR